MMKHMLFSILVIACCNTAFSQSDDKGNILAVEKSTADAFTKHNVTYLNAVFADDVTIVTTKGDIINKEQLMQYVPQVNSVTVSDMQVKIKTNIAIVTGIELETGRSDAGAYSNKIRFTDVLERKGGQWVITASHATAMEQ